MLREITLGQYYPVDSVLHRMDPRTKLLGTLLFIISLFCTDNFLGYGVAAPVSGSSDKAVKGAVQIYGPRP